jgi:hypothetical protein
VLGRAPCAIGSAVVARPAARAPTGWSSSARWSIASRASCKPTSSRSWLTRPIEALDDEKPVEVLARGNDRRIAKLITELEYPGVS